MRRRYELYLGFADLMAAARRDWSFRPKDLAGICAEKPERELNGREVLAAWEDYLSPRGGGERDRIELGIMTPYCRSRCEFCLFYKDHGEEDPLLEKYERELLRVISYFSDAFRGVRFSKKSFEGGTPTLFSEKQLERICSLVSASFSCRKGAFSDVEMHPYTITREKLEILAGHGFNYAVIGAQSLAPGVLEVNGRGCQTGAMVRDSVKWARGCGMSLSLDLVLGLAGDSPGRFLASFRRAAALAPDLLVIFRCSPTAYYLSRHFDDSREKFGAHLAGMVPALDRAVDWALGRGYALLPGCLEPGSDAVRLIPAGLLPRWRDYDLTRNCGDSRLKLGRGAHSSIIRGRLKYKSVASAADPADSLYRGRDPSRADETGEYVMERVFPGAVLDLKAFGARFGLAFDESFPGAAGALEAAGLASRSGGELRFAAGATPRELFAGCMFLLDFRRLAGTVRRMAAGRASSLKAFGDALKAAGGRSA